MTRIKSDGLIEVEEKGHLKNFGQIFLNKANKLIKDDKSITLKSLAKKASNENYNYSIKDGALRVTDLSTKEFFELQLPASRNSAV